MLMSDLILYHGSVNIVEKPKFGIGKVWNDYGQGFYCTKEKELAKEWAVSEETNGYVNHYSVNTSKLSLLNLNDYTTLHWLAILVANRQFAVSTPIMKHGKEWLYKNFLLPLEKYDLIKGYRADDSYFSFAKAFLSNQISYMQLGQAMKLGKLGEQIVIKSKKAFETIKFLGCENVNFQTYYPKKKIRDDYARTGYKKLLEEDDINGLFIRDILREKITENDPRLQ